jgi:hypothetical protein
MSSADLTEADLRRLSEARKAAWWERKERNYKRYVRQYARRARHG